MKTKFLFVALVMGLTIAACGPKTAEVAGEEGETPVAQKTAKDYTPSKATVDSVSYLMGINFGSFIKGYNFGDNMNYAEIVKGIKDFIKAEGNPRDEDFAEKNFKVNPELMNDMFNKYLEDRRNLVLLQNSEKEEAFLAANKNKNGVEVTGSGLQYKIIAPGSEVKAGPVDTVYVHYKGTLLDGTVFDEVSKDEEPIALTLNRVIPGWTEGLQLVGEGGEIELYIPANLGYGEQGSQGIEPNSTLIFNVNVAKVGKFVPAEEE